MKPVRWGVLGAAKVRAGTYGACDPCRRGGGTGGAGHLDPAKAAGFQAFCPSLTVHSSYDALLADPGIDAVYTRCEPHARGMDAEMPGRRKHVLTEKPIALKAREIDQIIAARDRSGLLAAEAYMIVHHPQWQRAKEWFEAVEIGIWSMPT